MTTQQQNSQPKQKPKQVQQQHQTLTQTVKPKEKPYLSKVKLGLLSFIAFLFLVLMSRSCSTNSHIDKLEKQIKVSDSLHKIEIKELQDKIESQSSSIVNFITNEKKLSKYEGKEETSKQAIQVTIKNVKQNEQ